VRLISIMSAHYSRINKNDDLGPRSRRARVCVSGLGQKMSLQIRREGACVRPALM